MCIMCDTIFEDIELEGPQEIAMFVMEVGTLSTSH